MVNGPSPVIEASLYQRSALEHDDGRRNGRLLKQLLREKALILRLKGLPSSMAAHYAAESLVRKMFK